MTKQTVESGTVVENVAESFNWQGFPKELKMEVIKRAHFLSRCAMRSCSKTEKALVDMSPTKCHSIRVAQLDKYPDLIKICVWDEGNMYSKITLTESEAVDTFLQLTSNKNSRFEEIIFDFKYTGLSNPVAPILPDYYASSWLSQKWLPILQECNIVNQVNTESSKSNFLDILVEKVENRSYPIKTKTFIWECNERNSRIVMEFFKKLHPAYLKRLYLENMPSKDIVADIVKTEQWKNLEGFSLCSLKSSGNREMDLQKEMTFSVENILMAKSFVVRGANTFKNSEILDIVKTFQTTSRPVGSFFDISFVYFGNELRDHLESTQHSKFRLKSRSQFLSDFIEIISYVFPMKDDAKVLLLNVNGRRIKGMVWNQLDFSNPYSFPLWMLWMGTEREYGFLQDDTPKCNKHKLRCNRTSSPTERRSFDRLEFRYF